MATLFSEFEDKALDLYNILRKKMKDWSDEDRQLILSIDGYEYIVLEEETDTTGRKSFITFCIGPREMTASEKDDVGYTTFTFDRCRYDVGGFAFDARDVILSPPENLDIDTAFASLDALRTAFQTRLVTTAF